jgi:mono/diheme cytochrome c family protein
MNFFDTGSSVWQCYGKLAKLIMTRRALILCIGVAFAASLLTSSAADKKAVDVSKIPPASDKSGVTYAADIKSIFEKSCIKCHGPEKQKGKLRLDSLAAALKGGEDGKVVEVGDSAKSMLVHNVAHVGDEDMFMPPPDNKDKIPPLTKEQIGLIRAWIDQGAK